MGRECFFSMITGILMELYSQSMAIKSSMMQLASNFQAKLVLYAQVRGSS